MKNLATLVLLILSFSTFSQEVDISDLTISENRFLGEILQDRIPFGYYSILKKDRVNEKQSLFNLKIFDGENLEVSSIDFIESNSTKILEAVFTGENIVFKIRKSSVFQNEIVFYQLDLNHNFHKIESYGSNEKVNKTYGLYNGLESISGSLFNIKNGFLNYYLAKDDSKTFQMDFFNLSNQSKWTYKPSVEAKKYKILNFLTKNDSSIVSLLSDYPGTTYGAIPQYEMEAFHSRKIKQYILFNSLSGGKLISSLPMFDDKYDYKIFNCRINEQKEAIATGLFYDKEGGIISSEPLGAIKIIISANGEIISKKLVSIQSIFKDNFPISNYPDLEGIGELFIHNIFPKNDEKVVLIAENILSTFEQKSIFKLENTYFGSISKDLFILEIDSAFEKSKLFHLEKYPVKLDGPKGVISLNSSALKLANYYKYTRQLDFIGTSISPDYKSYQILYRNKSKYEKVPEKFITCFANINGEIINDEYWVNEEKVTQQLFSFNFGKISLIIKDKKTKYENIIQKKFNFQ